MAVGPISSPGESAVHGSKSRHLLQLGEAERSCLPTGLMRLEERIVLDAAGLADHRPDGHGGDGHHGSAPAGDAATSHARGDGHDAVHAATDQTHSAAGVGSADENAPSTGIIEEGRFTRPSEGRDAATGLPRLLDGLLTGLGDVLRGTAAAVTRLVDTLADAVGRHWGLGTDGAAPGDAITPDHGDALPAADAVGSSSAGEADADPAATQEAGEAVSVLAISTSVDQANVLAAAAREGVLTTTFDGAHGTPDALLEQLHRLLGDHQATNIALVTNGLGAGRFDLTGGVSVDLDALLDPQIQAFWRGLAEMVTPGGRVDLLACDVAATVHGRALLHGLEHLTGLDFAASTNKTGNAAAGGDWVLERGGIDAASAYFDPEPLAHFGRLLGDLMPSITDTDPGHTAIGGGVAVVVDAGITVDDGDGGIDTLEGAAVRITTGFQAAEDELSFNEALATSFGISGSYNAATGELLLSGAASAAEYQQVLRTVTYRNTSVTPDTTARIILFVIGDDFDDPGAYSYLAQTGHYYCISSNKLVWATADSNASGSTLGGLTGYLATVTSDAENGIATNGEGDTWLGASDATTEGEWFWVCGPEAGTQFWQGDESGSPVGGMYENWKDGEPDGGASNNFVMIKADGFWEDKEGTSENYYVVEYGGLASDAEGQLTASVSVNVAAPTGPPTITDTDPGNTATGGAGPVVVDANISVTAGDAGNLTGAAVRIKTNFVSGEDVLAFDEVLAAGHGITGAYDAGTGELLLSGNGSAAQYQEVLRTVTYENTSAAPDTTARGIMFVVGDDFGTCNYSTDTGHYYEFVNDAVRPDDAETAADGSILYGLQGYLGTITSADENTFVANLIPGAQAPWLGASDEATEGEWLWTAGPEDGTQFWQGDAGGTAVAGMYTNWEAGQPDSASEQHFLSMLSTGTWQDEKHNVDHEYIVEYGGMAADAEGQLVASVTMNVAAPANHAPVLDNSGDMSLTAINEDATGGAGNTVASIIASAGGDRITDVDAGASEGIALTAVDTSHGTWQYSTNGGTDWTNVGAVAGTNALLLRDTDLLRFQPTADWNGTLASALTFRAWDQTTGSAGTYVDTSTNGGSTAFSSATETAAQVVNAVNDAPVLDNTGDMSLTAISEDATGGAGNTVASIIASAGGDRITDVDAGASEGIALTAVDTSHGTWQYSTNGGTDWTNVGAVAGTNALLLRDTDLLRFQPDANWNGTLASALTFRAWDQTSGAAGTCVDASTNGGSTAFSAATETASLVVNPVNDAPTVANPLVDQNATEDTPFTYQFAADSFADVDVGDVLSYAATQADGSALPGWLSFDAGSRTFSGTPGNADVGTVSIKVTADDGHGGTVTDTFTITVANVNDAPTVANPLVDQNATEDTPFTYQFAADSFADVDVGDVLSYAATQADGSALPGWLSFDAGSRTFSGTPGNADVGTVSIKVTADDGHGGTVTDTFTITVADGNEAPVVANPLVDQSATQDDAFTYQFAANTFADPDLDDTLTYAAVQADGTPLPGWLSFDAATRTFRGTPGSTDVGTVSVTVTANDGHGGTVSGSFVLTVVPVQVEVPVPPPNNNSGSSVSSDAAPAPPPEPPSAPVDEGGGVAADAPTTGEAADAGDGGSETSTTAGEGDAPSAESDAAAAGAEAAGGTAGPGGGVAHHERDEQDGFDSGQLAAQMSGAVFSGELLADETQPEEFREAWSTILGVYAGSSEEVSVYLTTAFRAVSESALFNEEAEQWLTTAETELPLAADAGINVDAEALLLKVREARQAVKAASKELESAIRAAAEAGKAEHFDAVLEDVVSAALQQLMTANEHLFVETQVLKEAVAALRESRDAAPDTFDEARFTTTVAEARETARAAMLELRKSWDRTAQDVFAAFVDRLAAEQAAGLPPTGSG